ncbi:MAG: AMP-binding protein, partial [Clostridia bacterium]|nr:AMP-binding protein [Clostridia bacterium]
MLDNYIQTHFDSYDEFRKNYKVNAPADFNFAYDVVDKYGTDEPDRRAMLWVSKEGEERTFTFGDMKRLSNKAANALKGLGIKKGDPVMLVLKRRYQFWYTMMALHKLGAIAIPGTFLLTDKEYVYRANAAGAKLIVCV